MGVASVFSSRADAVVQHRHRLPGDPRGECRPSELVRDFVVRSGRPRRSFAGMLRGRVLFVFVALAWGHPTSVMATGKPSSARLSAAATATSSSRNTLAYLSAVDKETAWAVVDTVEGGERVLRTTNGAASWSDVTPRQLTALVTGANVAAGAATPEVLFLGAKRAWTIAAGSLVTTADGGTTWRAVARLPKSCVPFQFVDSTHGWCQASRAAAGSEGIVLYRTVDGGLNWRRVTATGTSSLTKGALPFSCDKSINFTSETVGWAGLTCSKNLYETIDAGAHWVARAISGIPRSLAHAEILVHPPMLSGALGAGVLMVNDGVVMYRSENGGEYWQAVMPPGRLHSWDADIINPLEWRLADDRRIEYTDNAGRTWNIITPRWRIPPTKPPLNQPDIQFVSARMGWGTFYSPNGSIVLRTFDGGSRWTNVRSPA